MISAQKTADILNIFNAQGAMRLIGARLTEVDEGVAEFELDFRPELSQQDGFFHAGIIATLVDTAGGCAGATTMPASSGVLTVEYKLNVLAPGNGDKLRARGEVIKSGRTLTITQGKVWVTRDGKETLCALMQQTLIALPQK
ncbi:MAG: PaaI family thioesterase [Burkholderiales bacterium]|nr:PaaI family thioesterase [Burkholderiales bacterium]